jgi:hypothetical protein
MGWKSESFCCKQVTGDEKGGDFGNKLLNFIRKTTDKYDWIFMGAIPEELTGYQK